MPPTSLEQLVDDLTERLSLTIGDHDAILTQVGRLRAEVDRLDELPLEGVEPAGIFRVVPEVES